MRSLRPATMRITGTINTLFLPATGAALLGIDAQARPNLCLD